MSLKFPRGQWVKIKYPWQLHTSILCQVSSRTASTGDMGQQKELLYITHTQIFLIAPDHNDAHSLLLTISYDNSIIQKSDNIS